MRCCPGTVLSVLVLLILSSLPSPAMEAAEAGAEASSRHRDVVDRVLHLLKRNHRYKGVDKSNAKFVTRMFKAGVQVDGPGGGHSALPPLLPQPSGLLLESR